MAAALLPNIFRRLAFLKANRCMPTLLRAAEGFSLAGLLVAGGVMWVDATGELLDVLQLPWLGGCCSKCLVFPPGNLKQLIRINDACHLPVRHNLKVCDSKVDIVKYLKRRQCSL